ncbi:hypothetical protein BVX98_02995, partial [bacterium F11]
MGNSQRVGLSLIFVFLLAWGFLLPHVSSHVSSGDAGELALAGSTLGIAHSPGYPVFGMVNHALGSFFAFGNQAYRQNLSSLFFLCLCLVILGGLFVYLTDALWASFLPLLLLFSPHFRKSAYVTEVFPLAAVWAILILLVLVLYHRRRQGIFLVCFLLGLGFAIHQTLVLM